MLFNSYQFLLFFPAVTAFYFVLPRKIRMYWLLAASYYFYMCWNPLYALLMLSSTAITYASGLALRHAFGLEDRKRAARLGKACVACSFALNLAILFFFKYFYFTLDNLELLFGALRLSFTRPKVDVLLPVGISFYTFQALSYTMDVYRRELEAETNFFRYALFVSFFPQLVAGPIERSVNLLNQLRKPVGFRFDNMRRGLLTMLWGYFLKLVIADRAAILVDHVYNQYQGYVGWTLVVATVLFAVQIYCDFAGYSCIASGAAEVLGVKLMRNFRQPYFATGVIDFWRRWHISLSTWFRDYLYIPLGGNRHGWLRKSLNIMITFLVSGFWHGASWNYVVWGGLNGALQVAQDALGRSARPIKRALRYRDEKAACFSRRLLKTAVTFVIVNATWVFFRAQTLQEAVSIYRQMFSFSNPWVFFDGSLCRLGLDAVELGVLAVAILVLLAVDLLHEKGVSLRDQLEKQEFWFRCLIYLVAFFAVALLGVYGKSYDASVFIYFQF